MAIALVGMMGLLLTLTGCTRSVGAPPLPGSQDADPHRDSPSPSPATAMDGERAATPQNAIRDHVGGLDRIDKPPEEPPVDSTYPTTIRTVAADSGPPAVTRLDLGPIPGFPWKLFFSPDQRRLAFLQEDESPHSTDGRPKSLTVADLETPAGNPFRSFPAPGTLSGWYGNDQLVFMRESAGSDGSREREIVLVDAASGEEGLPLPVPPDKGSENCRQVFVPGEGREIFLACGDAILALDPGSGRVRTVVTGLPSGGGPLSPDGFHLPWLPWAGGDGASLHIIDLQRGAARKIADPDETYDTPSWRGDGRYLAVGVGLRTEEGRFNMASALTDWLLADRVDVFDAEGRPVSRLEAGPDHFWTGWTWYGERLLLTRVNRLPGRSGATDAAGNPLPAFAPGDALVINPLAPSSPLGTLPLDRNSGIVVPGLGGDDIFLVGYEQVTVADANGGEPPRTATGIGMIMVAEQAVSPPLGRAGILVLANGDNPDLPKGALVLITPRGDTRVLDPNFFTQHPIAEGRDRVAYVNDVFTPEGPLRQIRVLIVEGD